MSKPDILVALRISGVLGMVGQGVRAVAGLKKMGDDASQQDASAADLFTAARLVVSLLIGFIAGVIAGLSLGLDAIQSDTKVLLGIAAAGYAGADFVEAFIPTITGAVPPKLVRLAADCAGSRTSYTPSVMPGSTACNSASGSSARVQLRASARRTISPVA